MPSTVLESARRLLDVLEREHAALARGDAPALSDCVSEKNRLLAEIEGFGRAGPAPEERSFGVESPARDPETQRSRQNLRALLEQCAQRNRVNGRIIELSRQRTQRALAILRGQAAADIYGPGGTAAPAPSAHRSIAKA